MPSRTKKRQSKFRIVQTKEKEAVKVLHSLLFSDSPWDDEGQYFWLLYEKGKYYPVGFCVGRRNQHNKRWFMLLRAGVLPESRGHNLQQSLIEVREKLARQLRCKGCLTTVANWNTPSLMNLLKSGYTVRDPLVKRGKKMVTAPRDGYLTLCKEF